MNTKDFCILFNAFLEKHHINSEVRFEVGKIEDEWQDNLVNNGFCLGGYIKKWVGEELEYQETVVKGDHLVVRLSKK